MANFLEIFPENSILSVLVNNDTHLRGTLLSAQRDPSEWKIWYLHTGPRGLESIQKTGTMKLQILISRSIKFVQYFKDSFLSSLLTHHSHQMRLIQIHIPTNCIYNFPMKSKIAKPTLQSYLNPG